MKQYLERILTDSEKDQIKSFVANKPMRAAVYKVLLAGIYTNGVLRKDLEFDSELSMANAAFAVLNQERMFPQPLSNEKVGEDLRALWEGTQALKMGFDEMDTLMGVIPPKKGRNEAR